MNSPARCSVRGSTVSTRACGMRRPDARRRRRQRARPAARTMTTATVAQRRSTRSPCRRRIRCGETSLAHGAPLRAAGTPAGRTRTRSPTTIAVAMPASATAPVAPARRIRVGAALVRCVQVVSSTVRIGVDHGRLSPVVPCAGVRLRAAHRRATIAPGGADIGDHGGDLVVGQALRERRHAVGLRIPSVPGGKPPFSTMRIGFTADCIWIDWIARERRIVRRHAAPVGAVADRALRCRRPSGRNAAADCSRPPARR